MADQVAEWDASGKPIAAPAATSVHTEWDASGKPISTPTEQPKTLIQKATSLIDVGHLKESVADAESKANGPTTLADAQWRSDHPHLAAVRSFINGVGADAAKSLLTPAGLALAATGGIGEGAEAVAPALAKLAPSLAPALGTAAKVVSGAGRVLTGAGGAAGAMHGGADLATNIKQQEGENDSDYQRRILGDAAALTGGTAAAMHAAPVASDAALAVRQSAPVQAVADKAQAVGSKVLPSLVDGPPESMLTRAIKPTKNNTNWNTDLQKAAPLMKSAEAAIGKPIAGVDDAIDAAAHAKKDIWQQYQQRLGASGQAGATIDGNSIADAMVDSIDKRTAAQNPGLVNKIKATADTYRRPLPLSEAEDFLQSANKDLNTYYLKNKVGQQVAEGDPETAYTVAEAKALRKGLYDKLDTITGPGAAQLKQAYGALTNVEKELYGRQLVAARANPESLSEQLSTVAGAGRIAKGMATFNPGDVLEGAQNIAVSRALKARNSSDSMIERAFQKTSPATPFPLPSSPRLAGLLERGPIQMGGPAESSNATMPPPPVAATTRAQRLGLLLPEKAGGNVLPYYPQLSESENLVILKNLLRKKMPPALPSKASAIPLGSGE